MKVLSKTPRERKPVLLLWRCSTDDPSYNDSYSIALAPPTLNAKCAYPFWASNQHQQHRDFS